MQRQKLLIGVLLVFGLFSMGFSFDQTGNTCTCYDAADCNNAISSSSCSVIKLGADINGKITFNGVSNKVLDCQNYKIAGNFWDIYFSKINNNITITNCKISGNYGIFFSSTKNFNIKIKNCKIYSNVLGISFNYEKQINTNITIENCNIYGDNGINFDNTINTNITILNNTINCYYTGIFFRISTNTNVLIENCSIKATNVGIYLSELSNNITIIKNKFNISKEYIKIWGKVKNLFLNNSKYGNYYGKTDGTGYSDTCNDTNYDGFCDQSYSPISGYTDHLPLAGHHSTNPPTNGVPDLIITSMSTYSDIAPNQTVNVTIDVKNNGSANITNSFNVSLYANNILIGKATINSLNAGVGQRAHSGRFVNATSAGCGKNVFFIRDYITRLWRRSY